MRIPAILASAAVAIAMLPAALGLDPARAAERTPSCTAVARAERDIVRLVNAARRAHGLLLVRANRALGAAARSHSCDMLRRNYFEHDSPGRRGAWDARVRRFVPRARVLAETLAWGSRRDAQAATLVRWWLASPPHRAVLLDPQLRLIGIGAARGRFRGQAGALVATADFAAL